MKGFAVFTKSLIFVLILSASAFAQTEKTKTPDAVKIGSIDTTVFYDKEKGIKEVVEAHDKIEVEFKPQADELQNLVENILKLQKEIEAFQSAAEKFKGICLPDEIFKKLDDYDKLTTEYKQKQESLKSIYDKRKPEIFADVYKKVGDAINQFKKEKSYVIIIDSSKSTPGMILGDLDDVTKEFIKYYNENFAETKTR